MEVREYNDDGVQQLSVLPAFVAHKTLGHYKDPAGTQQEQYRQLKKKAILSQLSYGSVHYLGWKHERFTSHAICQQ